MDEGLTHFRAVDLTNILQIKALLAEVESPDIVIMSADTGTAFGKFNSLSHKDINEFLNAKINGSVSFLQEICKREAECKVIWLCGKENSKDPDYMLYRPVNAFINALISEINANGSKIKAYYLETPAIASPIYSAFQRRCTVERPEWKIYTPDILLESFRDILNDNQSPGLVRFTKPELIP